MRLKLSEWAERSYSDKSRPHDTTLRRMAADGEIPGAFRTATGRWFVDDSPIKSSYQIIGMDKAIEARKIEDAKKDKSESDFVKNWRSFLPDPETIIKNSVDCVEYLYDYKLDTAQVVYFLINSQNKINYVGVSLYSFVTRVKDHANNGKEFSRVYIHELDEDDVSLWVETICISWFQPKYNKAKGSPLSLAFDVSNISELPDVSNYVDRMLITTIPQLNTAAIEGL